VSCFSAAAAVSGFVCVCVRAQRVLSRRVALEQRCPTRTHDGPRSHSRCAASQIPPTSCQASSRLGLSPLNHGSEKPARALTILTHACGHGGHAHARACEVVRRTLPAYNSRTAGRCQAEACVRVVRAQQRAQIRRAVAVRAHARVARHYCMPLTVSVRVRQEGSRQPCLLGPPTRLCTAHTPPSSARQHDGGASKCAPLFSNMRPQRAAGSQPRTFKRHRHPLAGFHVSVPRCTAYTRASPPSYMRTRADGAPMSA
jgi:hypothetical protein